MAIGRIPENVLEDILSRVDIVEVISSCIPLKRAGRNFKTTCPFHHEKTPSFMVSADKQIYHCFGCGESGNAFKFLMSYERLDFPEAVEVLAKKAGVVLPQIRNEDTKSVNLSTQLYKINELAANFYENSLNSPQGDQAKQYLLKRGISEETIKLCKLGFACDKWDSLLTYLRAKNVPISLIEKAGLILPKDNGGYYDRFRNRVIFPIMDIKSRVLGFGARVLDNSLPKYINSPETPVYTKGKNLYGLNLSKESIREKDSVVIVEGQLDFITPFSKGLKNIVASQGTALTVEQIRLLKRYAHDVVMLYDGDQAGQIATLRSLDLLIEEELDARVVNLPSGLDPDSFIRKLGIEAFAERVQKASSIFDYKLAVLKSRFNPAVIENKAKISAGMLETIGKYKNEVVKSEYIKKLSQDLKIDEAALLKESKKTGGDKAHNNPEQVTPKKILNINPTEKLLLKLMMEEKDIVSRIKDSLEPGDFQDARASKIVSIMFDLLEQGKSIEPHILINHLGEEEVSRVVCESMFLPDDLSSEQREKVVNDCINRLKSEKVRLKKNNLAEQIKSAQDTGDEENLNRLMHEFHNLIKKN